VPTGTVSTAGFIVPLCALWTKMFPTVTLPTAPPPFPPAPPFPPSLGDVLSLEQAKTDAAAPISSQVLVIRIQSS
jgi:hypothetical protein